MLGSKQKPTKHKPAPEASDQGSIAALSTYYKPCRLLVFVAMAVALMANIIEQPLSDTLTLIIASTTLVYAFATYSLYYNSKKPSITRMLTIVDGIIVAVVISQWLYSPWPSALLIIIFYFTTLYYGGLSHWLSINIGIIAGIGASYFGLGNTTINMDSHIIANIAVLIASICVFCTYAFYYRKQAASIEQQHQQLNEELKNQKLRIYEMSRFLPKPVWDHIEGKKKPKIERKPITVFFSDIVGFSRLSEELEAETLSNVLSSYLAEMSKIVEQYNGTIDKFIGDAIMVTFGDDDSVSNGVKADAIACVSMAMAMGKRMRELQATWSEMGIKKPLQIRIGINSGYCTVGTFGISKHLDHTALGVHVNLASRLESAGQPEEILVSHETWSLIKDSILCRDKGKIKAKGFSHPVQVYQVINHRKELGANQSYFSENAEGFSIHLDMEKVKNYDRQKVITALEAAAKKLKGK